MNVLVNEMNALDVKKLEDGDIIRKIIGGLHKPDYDIISSILLGQELKGMTPNMIVNKLMAHELQTGLMPKDKPSTPSSPTPSIV